jgi:hypothetical protein
VGSQQKKKKGTPDPRLIVSDIKREADQAAVRTALQPTTEVGRNPITRSMIDFVNVTETIDPAQNGINQITGLIATPVSNTQINLAWTAYSPLPPGFTNYNVYHSTTPGFTPASGNLLSSPVSNSYNNTGLTVCTDHYYRVTGEAGGVEGSPSDEGSGTTTGCIPLTPFLSLSLDNNYTNSGNGGQTIASSGAVFATPGKFGTHYSNINSSGSTDSITVSNANLNISTLGVSFSFWIRPQNISAQANDRQVFCWQNQNGGLKVYFDITTEGWYKVQVQKTGMGADKQRGNATNPVVNVWNHIVITFSNAGNVLELYVDKVAGIDRTFHSDFSGTVSNPPNSLIIAQGTLAAGQIFPYIGHIDEFKVYNSAVLTQTQINNLFSINATA